MSFDLKRMYELLPALHRIRDTELGIQLLTPTERVALEKANASIDQHVHGPLKSLLSIIADQVAVLEENLDQLYDDQFIETCAEWAVAYIGGLVGTRDLNTIAGAGMSQRAEVANTIAYRRRKGTASVIEQLARNVTGWNSNVTEYFQWLATTQYMNHIRPDNLSISGLRDWEKLAYADTPFDKMAHTVDVRNIEKQRGKYNIPNIGIYLWRLNSYASTQSPAYRVDDRRFKFDAVGKDTQLYHLPETEETITHLAEPVNVPMPIARRVLHENLDTYYGEGKSILIYNNQLLDDGAAIPENVSPSGSITATSEMICICDLRDELDGLGNVIGWANMPDSKIAIDPVLGRIAFPTLEAPPGEVHVSYHYGFSADMGGGEYGRSETFINNSTDLIFEVSAGVNTIQQGLDALQMSGGIVEIIDNEYYVETPIIRVAPGKTIEIRSVDKKRPVLVLDDYIKIEAGIDSKVIINGLLISGGGFEVESNQPLQSLNIKHCTLVPTPSPVFEFAGGTPATVGAETLAQARLLIHALGTSLEIENSIVGAIRLVDGASLSVTDSIVDATAKNLVAFMGIPDLDAGGEITVDNSTIIGKVKTILMERASNTIFMAEEEVTADWPVSIYAQRLQQGCVRFSYFPPGSRLPRPYRCQPANLGLAARVRPILNSMIYGEASYGQLSPQTAIEITEGADDESEMGAFHQLYQAQRVSNLRIRLDEYLRFGMEAGIFFAS